MAREQRPIAIIGSGIVGVAAAIWLERAGYPIILIDRQAPGEGASYGNAGVLAACSVAPITGPGLPLRAPRLLMDPEFPLFVIWRRFPFIAPWLLRYLSHSGAAETRRIAHALAPLVSDAVHQHRDLATGTPAERWLSESDYIFAYRSREAFAADEFAWRLRAEAGFVPSLIEAPLLGEILAEAGPEIGLLAMLKDHGFIASPGRYVTDLAATVSGPIVTAEVHDLELSGGHVCAVETAAGRYPCAAVIIAAGAWSRQLVKRLGISVPLETERGYHLLLRNPSHSLPCPVMVASGKFVATPMADGIRCAGAVEFGGLDPAPSDAPIDLIRRQTATAFPRLSWDGEEEWLGHRPAPADSIPLIGQIRDSGIYTAFGHHHIGLTAGPKTGRIVAAMIGGREIDLDLTPYSPNRFGPNGSINH